MADMGALPRYLMALIGLRRALSVMGRLAEAREQWQKAIDIATPNLNPTKPSRSFGKIVPGFDKEHLSPEKIVEMVREYLEKNRSK